MLLSSSISLGSGGGAATTGFLTATGVLEAPDGATGAAVVGAAAAVAAATVALATGVVAVALVVVLVSATGLAALAAVSGAETAGADNAGAAGRVKPGSFAVADATAAGVPGAAGVTPAILFRSPMFLASSATRLEASLACLSLAILSSAAALPCKAPFDSVNLSGTAAAEARSSTLA